MIAYLGNGPIGPLLLGTLLVGAYLAVLSIARRRYPQPNEYERLKRGIENT